MKASPPVSPCFQGLSDFEEIVVVVVTQPDRTGRSRNTIIVGKRAIMPPVAPLYYPVNFEHV
jgi:hypothetical protein